MACQHADSVVTGSRVGQVFAVTWQTHLNLQRLQPGPSLRRYMTQRLRRPPLSPMPTIEPHAVSSITVVSAEPESDPLVATPGHAQPAASSVPSTPAVSSPNLAEESVTQPLAYQLSFQQQLRRFGWQALLTQPDLRSTLKHVCPLCSQWAATPSGLKVHLQQSPLRRTRPKF